LENHSFMNDLFPFYVLVDKNMKVVNLGRSQVKLKIISKGDDFLSVLSIERPFNLFSFKDIIRQKNALFILTSIQNHKHKFRGQIFHDEKYNLLCFLGSPLINSFEELKCYDLTLGDFAVFDNISQFLFTLQMQLSSLNDSKRIAEKLRVYKDQLEISLAETKQAKQNQQSFFAKMSHELRTPLNAIIGMGELLQGTELNTEQRKYLRAVAFSSNSLLQIINDILDFSKLKSDQFSLEKISFSIRKIIEDIYHSFKYQARDKNLELSYFVSEDIFNCIGDPLRISQVIINLVNNAIKFTETGTVEIRVALKSEDSNYQKIEVSVTDSGKGIKKDKLERIFQGYTQEDEGITREFGGTGLGLTIAQEIVSNYNSKINVETEEGKGTRFYFELKLKKSNEVETKKKDPKSIDYNFKAVKILLVEDNAINRFYAETILTQKKAVVSIAVNGREAVEKVQSENFDIILMDMQMPVLNGLDATQEIRTDLKSKTPIIGLSANTVQEDINNCYKVGMNGYITKPFEPIDLHTKIGEILNLEQLISVNQPIQKVKVSYSLKQVKSITNGNTELIIKMLELFNDKTPSDIERMKFHLQKKEWKPLFELTHKIKPSFGILGITKGEELCLSIEKFKSKQPQPKLLKGYILELEKIVQSISSNFKKEITKMN